MSVNYSLAYMSSEPGNPDAPKKYYAKMQAKDSVSLDQIAEDIAYSTTLTDSDVVAVIRAFIREMNKHLANGMIVRAENLGSFQLQLQSTGTETVKEFKPSNITGVNIQFRPGKTLKAATRAGDGGLTFVRVKKKSGDPLPDEEDTDTEDPGGGAGTGEDPLG